MQLKYVKQQLRSGPYMWPGGYPQFFVTSDSAALCFECVRLEWRNIVQAHLWHDKHSGWHIECSDVNWEDPSLHCDHCSKRIESAYAEDEAAV